MKNTLASWRIEANNVCFINIASAGVSQLDSPGDGSAAQSAYPSRTSWLHLTAVSVRGRGIGRSWGWWGGGDNASRAAVGQPKAGSGPRSPSGCGDGF